MTSPSATLPHLLLRRSTRRDVVAGVLTINEKSPAEQGFSYALEWTRTTTGRKAHKALNPVFSPRAFLELLSGA
jgi:hypothetical protein